MEPLQEVEASGVPSLLGGSLSKLRSKKEEVLWSLCERSRLLVFHPFRADHSVSLDLRRVRHCGASAGGRGFWYPITFGRVTQ